MATIVATGNGNWSSTTPDAPWPSGTKPSSGDTVQTSAFVIEIDENITVALLEATSTGHFAVSAWSSGTLTINANVLNSWPGAGDFANGALTITNSGGLVVLNGNVTGGSQEVAFGIYNENTIGDITGDVTGGSGTNAFGIYNGNTIGDITGDVTGGSGTNAHGIYVPPGGI